MKRIWVCLGLLLISAALCVSSYFSVIRTASTETEALKEVLTALQKEDYEKAKTALLRCQKVWEQKNLPFYLFYHHDLFEEFDSVLAGIDLYMETDPDYAKAKVGACLSVMEDMINLQRVNVKNIF